ncbi:MAG: hypothetical protein COA71_07045 [SAR86 cluster bacterium]|uniref:Twin-arginine translocation pathway signal n=1 Tax=SAR86 cluster bacterium TaxID=2030880 RepID=A0A2A5CDA8_9GAMM|nr:DUF1513 domain-containing protein [Gammaproteobacteria bacterium AH-315-E17]PCJ41762.1 MAG: hypothetical protein COA71_07045 [SAR86 cluster bacterium]
MSSLISSYGLPRRSFLGLAVLLAANPAFTLGDARQPIFLSAASDRDDKHWLKAFTRNNDQLELLYSHQLNERAHAVTLNNKADIFVTVARRPGTSLLVGEVQSGGILQEVQAPGGRHFYGHGVFSADDNYFYTTENDYEDMQGDSGRIGVWRISNTAAEAGGEIVLERVNEFASYGVGPHELLLMPDEETLVIANGGIRTHPDLERDKLNIESMQPSLTYIDRQSGTLLEQKRLPAEFHQASIRHIDINAQGQIALSMQFEGEPFVRAPLVASHQRGEAIQSMLAPEQVQSQMAQYVGSIRYDQSGRFLVASCPRANMLTFWDVETGEFIRQLRARDACGVCAYEDGFLYSAGTGQIRYYDLIQRSVTDFTMSDDFSRGLFWDNHLVVA